MNIKFEIESRDHFALYLFGSAVYSDSPSDIDVAIIYDKRYVDIREAIAYRHALVEDMMKQSSMMIDSILLSMEEELEMSFLENAKYLKI